MKIKTAPRSKAGLVGKVFIAVDVSGSARREQLVQAVKQAETIARALGATQATYLAFDHRIESQERAKLGTVRVEDLMEHGGGGTDFRPLFAMLADCPSTSLMIVVSDMLASVPVVNPVPRTTIIWLDTEGDHLPTPPPFGLLLSRS
jgi:predicted metal-dependent peptidase